MRRTHVRVSEARLAIRRVVEEQPGIHFRGLARAASVSSAGQLRHHLDKLERDGQVVEVGDGRYRRFFIAGRHDPALRAEMARFSRAVPRRIARLLLDNPMNRTQLRRSLHCADSTLGYHLSRMVMVGDLARVRGPQSCVYSLAREDQVRRMLLEHGLPDDGPALPVPPAPTPGEPDLEPGSLLADLRPVQQDGLGRGDDGLPDLAGPDGPADPLRGP